MCKSPPRSRSPSLSESQASPAGVRSLPARDGGLALRESVALDMQNRMKLRGNHGPFMGGFRFASNSPEGVERARPDSPLPSPRKSPRSSNRSCQLDVSSVSGGVSSRATDAGCTGNSAPVSPPRSRPRSPVRSPPDSPRSLPKTNRRGCERPHSPKSGRSPSPPRSPSRGESRAPSHQKSTHEEVLASFKWDLTLGTEPETDEEDERPQVAQPVKAQPKNVPNGATRKTAPPLLDMQAALASLAAKDAGELRGAPCDTASNQALPTLFGETHWKKGLSARTAERGSSRRLFPVLSRAGGSEGGRTSRLSPRSSARSSPTSSARLSRPESAPQVGLQRGGPLKSMSRLTSITCKTSDLSSIGPDSPTASSRDLGRTPRSTVSGDISIPATPPSQPRTVPAPKQVRSSQNQRNTLNTARGVGSGDRSARSEKCGARRETSPAERPLAMERAPAGRGVRGAEALEDRGKGRGGAERHQHASDVVSGEGDKAGRSEGLRSDVVGGSHLDTDHAKSAGGKKGVIDAGGGDDSGRGRGRGRGSAGGRGAGGMSRLCHLRSQLESSLQKAENGLHDELQQLEQRLASHRCSATSKGSR